MIIYSLEKEDGSEVPLLTTIEETARYYESAQRQRGEKDDWPRSFAFPRSFSYDLTFGLVTRSNKQERIYEGSQSAVFDSESNRVRIEREMRVFQETDTSVKLYDFDKMRLLVSDPVKKVCLKSKIRDISPVSMVPREHDQIVISDALQSIWELPAAQRGKRGSEEEDSERVHKPQAAKTQYLGEHKVTSRQTTTKNLLDTEYFHIFKNNYNFLDLETKFAQGGGADGATTLYLFRELVDNIDEDEANSKQKTPIITYQLAGVVTKYLNQKPDVYASLGTSFRALDSQILDTNELQLKFY